MAAAEVEIDRRWREALEAVLGVDEAGMVEAEVPARR